MASCLSQTLIGTTKAFAAASSSSSSSSSSFYSSIFLSRTHYSTHSHSHSSSHTQLPDVPEAEAVAVRRIEDAIHRIIVKRSIPDWLPFLPGASYWVPPKRRNYGIAELVNKLANSLSDDQVMSLTTSRGWPSSAFYTQPSAAAAAAGDASSERIEAVEPSLCASVSEDELG